MHPLKPRRAVGECPQPRAPSRPRPKSLPRPQESHLLRAFYYARDHYKQYLNDLETAERLRAQYGRDFDYILEWLTNLRDMLPTSVQTTTQPTATGNRTLRSGGRDNGGGMPLRSSCYLRLGHDATSITDSISLGKNEVKVGTYDGVVSIKSQILTQG